MLMQDAIDLARLDFTKLISKFYMTIDEYTVMPLFLEMFISGGALPIGKGTSFCIKYKYIIYNRVETMIVRFKKVINSLLQKLKKCIFSKILHE